MKYRSSYGQNCYNTHAKLLSFVSNGCRIGLNLLAKRAGLLHDIVKPSSEADIETPHAILECRAENMENQKFVMLLELKPR
jgi:hypothetical protein